MKLDRRQPDRYEACLLGGAVGDALGAPIEFSTLDAIRKRYGPTGVTDYIEYSDGHGEFTDDTQMTLFTAEAVIRARHREAVRGIGGGYYDIQYHSYVRWLETQGDPLPKQLNEQKKWIESGWLFKQKPLYKTRAPGNTCLAALRSGVTGSVEKPVNQSKGCGGVMRAAPVGLAFPGNPKNAYEFGVISAAITHGHPTGCISTGAFAAIIAGLAGGDNLRSAIDNAVGSMLPIPDSRETVRAIEQGIHAAKHGKLTGEELEKLGGGWVAEEALSISLACALAHQDDFMKGVTLSINHGGDSDSTGSIAGNILGLINGIEAIPNGLVERLEGAQIVRQVANDLFTMFSDEFDGFESDEWVERYPGW